MSSANSCASLQSDEARLRSAGMSRERKDSAERPIFHADLGRILQTSRGKRAIKTVTLQAKERGFSVTDNQIRWIEAGKTQHPDQGVLRALCAVYGLDYESFAWNFINRNYGLQPEFALEPLQLPIDPTAQMVVEALERVRGAARTQAAELLRTLAEALDTDR
jgi:transcriptional regulator with XRE-family HTH domain